MYRLNDYTALCLPVSLQNVEKKKKVLLKLACCEGKNENPVFMVIQGENVYSTNIIVYDVKHKLKDNLSFEYK